MMLSPDQETAKAAVLAALLKPVRRGGWDARKPPEAVLVGPAGSGKTTLLKSVLADLKAAGREVTLLAPTAKAASRAKEVVGVPARTIHSALYRRVIEDEEDGDPFFDDPQAVATGGGVVVVDEASMVGSRLYDDLVGKLPPDVPVLWVGDKEQLPPVKDTWGPDLDNPTGHLTQVHRQAQGSPIIRLATAIRMGGDWRRMGNASGFHRAQGRVAKVGQWLAAERRKGRDSICLTWANATRHRVNAAVREARGHVGDAPVPGDRLVCLRNNHALGWWNGEVREVVSTHQEDPWRPEPGLGADMWLGPRAVADGALAVKLGRGVANLLVGARMGNAVAHRERQLAASGQWERGWLTMADWGECLTIHKSQGSQWDRVCIVMDDKMAGLERRNREDFRRLLYTAVTRAREALFIVEV